MEKEEILEYLNKKVKVTLKSRYVYTGKVLSINETTFTIDDWKDGETKVEFNSVSSVSKVKW